MYYMKIDHWSFQIKGEEMASSKKRRRKSQKSQLPAAPFRLSSDDLKLADKRTMNVCVPVGYGWKPGPFFCKKPYLKSHDWKQVHIVHL